MNMTASASSIGSTIERPRPPDPERSVPVRPSVAAVVASLHARTGKTLLARVLADYFILSGIRPLLFDTDTTERTLYAAFPNDTVVVDPSEVRDQMLLFDTLVAQARLARVVDVAHHAQRKFFKVMENCDFIAEARLRQVETVIFYMADRNPDTYDEALRLHDRFEGALVLVENAWLGRVKEATRRNAGYRALEAHDLRMSLPRLDPDVIEAIEDPSVSLSEIMNRPLSRNDERRVSPLSFEQQAAVRSWLMKVFRDIHRVTRAVEMNALSVAPANPLI